MLVREFQESDSEKLKDLLIKNWKHHVNLDPWGITTLRVEYGEFAVKDLVKHYKETKDSYFPIIEIDGEVVGFGFANIKSHDEKYRLKHKDYLVGHLQKLYVDDSLRGKGLGKLLIQKMEDYLISKGVNFITLHVYDWNKGALELYTKLGYKDFSSTLIKEVQK